MEPRAPNARFLPRLDSLPSGPGAEPRGTLSPSLRCSAASLVSWESEMKHCSSGREKLFCGRQPGSGKWWWGSWALGNMGAFPRPTLAAVSAEEIPGLKAYPCHPVLRDSGQVLTPLGPAVCPSVKRGIGAFTGGHYPAPCLCFLFLSPQWTLQICQGVHS